MKTHTVAPEAAPEEPSRRGKRGPEKHNRDCAPAAAAAATVTVVVLGGKHDSGVGGLRLASRGMRIVGVRGGKGTAGGVQVRGGGVEAGVLWESRFL